MLVILIICESFYVVFTEETKTRLDILHLLTTSSNYPNKVRLMAGWTEKGREARKIPTILRSQGETGQNRKMYPSDLLALCKPSIMSELELVCFFVCFLGLQKQNTITGQLQERNYFLSVMENRWTAFISKCQLKKYQGAFVKDNQSQSQDTEKKKKKTLKINFLEK